MQKVNVVYTERILLLVYTTSDSKERKGFTKNRIGKTNGGKAKTNGGGA